METCSANSFTRQTESYKRYELWVVSQYQKRVQPRLHFVEAGDWDSTLWMIGGPVFFSLLAMAIYQNYCSRMANKPELALD